MMKKISSLLLLFVFFFSCKKEKGSEVVVPPSDLDVKADVSTDNSGNVLFIATAKNAINYEFDLGNGVFKLEPSGKLNYKYPSTGNYAVKVFAKNSTGQMTSKALQISVNVGLSLLWSDEFNVSGTPDPSKWNYDIGTGSGGWGNNELQYYTSRQENVFVSNGTLKIVANKESFGGSNYTSARLLTRDKFSFKYGKIEARAKLPAGVGTWPAIWMLGENIGTVGWPACGEIDIMEHKGSQLNKIYGTIHYPGFSGGNAVGGTTSITNATTEFHVYSVEWSENTIRFLVDGISFFTVANSSSIPFNHNFFLLLNLAMGGNFGGAVDPLFSQAQMEIDYIRVYQ
jgi:beta-glucanase (GH16 family)